MSPLDNQSLSTVVTKRILLAERNIKMKDILGEIKS